MLDLSVTEISHDHNTSCPEYICALLKNSPPDCFYLRFFARIIGVPITPALWGEEEPPHKVKAYLPDTPTAYGE